jgi:hypothetical protein
MPDQVRHDGVSALSCLVNKLVRGADVMPGTGLKPRLISSLSFSL